RCPHERVCYPGLIRLVRIDGANAIEQKLPLRLEPVVEVAAVGRAPPFVNDECALCDLVVPRNVDRGGDWNVNAGVSEVCVHGSSSNLKTSMHITVAACCHASATESEIVRKVLHRRYRERAFDVPRSSGATAP